MPFELSLDSLSNVANDSIQLVILCLVIIVTLYYLFLTGKSSPQKQETGSVRSVVTPSTTSATTITEHDDETTPASVTGTSTADVLPTTTLIGNDVALAAAGAAGAALATDGDEEDKQVPDNVSDISATTSVDSDITAVGTLDQISFEEKIQTTMKESSDNTRASMDTLLDAKVNDDTLEEATQQIQSVTENLQDADTDQVYMKKCTNMCNDIEVVEQSSTVAVEEEQVLVESVHDDAQDTGSTNDSTGDGVLQPGTTTATETVMVRSADQGSESTDAAGDDDTPATTVVADVFTATTTISILPDDEIDSHKANGAPLQSESDETVTNEDLVASVMDGVEPAGQAECKHQVDSVEHVVEPVGQVDTPESDRAMETHQTAPGTIEPADQVDQIDTPKSDRVLETDHHEPMIHVDTAESVDQVDATSTDIDSSIEKTAESDESAPSLLRDSTREPMDLVEATMKDTSDAAFGKTNESDAPAELADSIAPVDPVEVAKDDVSSVEEVAKSIEPVILDVTTELMDPAEVTLDDVSSVEEVAKSIEPVILDAATKIMDPVEVTLDDVPSVEEVAKSIEPVILDAAAELMDPAEVTLDDVSPVEEVAKSTEPVNLDAAIEHVDPMGATKVDLETEDSLTREISSDEPATMVDSQQNMDLTEPVILMDANDTLGERGSAEQHNSTTTETGYLDESSSLVDSSKDLATVAHPVTMIPFIRANPLNKPKQEMSRVERIEQQRQPYIPLYKSRCAFWPGCTNNHCKYYHPFIECRNGKACQYGKKCVFLHPKDYNAQPKAGKGKNKTSKKAAPTTSDDTLMTAVPVL